MATIKNLIFAGKLTAQQEALSTKIEESLETIMENPQGYFYDFIDIRKYKTLLQTLNDEFRTVFPGTKGLYAYQSDYYNIQSALENKYKHKVDGIFAFMYREDEFRYAFLQEVAIYLHKNEHPVIYPIQVRAITVWLLVCYFDIERFKVNDYIPVFAFVDSLLDTDMKIIEDIWGDINVFRAKYDEAIREYNRQKSEMRAIMRKARRCVSATLMCKELEIHHFMAEEYYFHNYSKLLEAVAEHYHRSVRSIRKRAKEIGLTPERYFELLPEADNCWQKVRNEINQAQQILDNGPLHEWEVFDYYSQRFSMFRTFWSNITDDFDDIEDVQRREDERNRDIMLVKNPKYVEWLDQQKRHWEELNERILKNYDKFVPRYEGDNPLLFELPLFESNDSTAISINNPKRNKPKVAPQCHEHISDTSVMEMTPEIVDQIMNASSNAHDVSETVPHKAANDELDWERILNEINSADESTDSNIIPKERIPINIEDVLEDIRMPSAVASPKASAANPIDLEDVLDQIY